uniref:Dynein light chain n=1 Tax=Mesocestoides corti TaxID=53468 RepID=A0A5K3F642_MESCO
MSRRKVVVTTTDMSDEMQQFAVEAAYEAIRNAADNQQIASYIRNSMLEEFPGNWHCIVGSNFGSEVTHGKRGLIFFKIAGHGVLLFRSV